MSRFHENFLLSRLKLRQLKLLAAEPKQLHLLRA